MSIIQVIDSKRKKMRDMNDSLGDDILRYIAEVLTNSDDSYRRLEAKYPEIEHDIKKIYIELKKEKKNNKAGGYTFTITDNAEGISEERLRSIFEKYGNDNAGGTKLHARGIFGQGASDVLRNAAYYKKKAIIETIENGILSILRYNVDNSLNYSINVEKMNINEEELEQYRENNKIPSNGTKFIFGVPDKVKFNQNIIDKLPELIAKYPYFRYILQQENRQIIYKYEQENPIIISSKEFAFKEKDIIYRGNFNFYFDNQKINCKLKMYKNTNKNTDNTDILVIDQNNSVFDNTMFDFKNSPLSKNISGELTISNLYDLCYKYLNLENKPIAIVKDNRTGFDTTIGFYKELSKKIAPIIEKVLNEHGEVKITDLANNKKFSDALKKLNKYIKADLKDTIGRGNINGRTPPLEGIKFARTHISITKGKKYDLKLYINSEIISYDEIINIEMTDNNNIEVTPKEIIFNEMESEDGVIIKNITIEALNVTNQTITISAKTDNRIANVAVDVIEEEIHYPIDGLEFYPSEVTLINNTKHNLKLFVDSEVIPINSEIEIINTDEEIQIEKQMLKFTSEDLINDSIGIMDVKFQGGKLNHQYNIKAKYHDMETIVNISIITSEEKEKSGGGLISGFKLEPNENAYYQAYFHPYDHNIYINNKHQINLIIMGEMRNMNPDKPYFDKHQRKYLCDIIANEAAKILMKKHIEKGEINLDNFEEAIDKIQNMTQEHKTKIYKEIYSAMEE